MKDIIILGSTGSIGVQALEVIKETKIGKIFALSGHTNIDLLYKQIIEFAPSYAVITDPYAYEVFIKRYRGETIILKGIKGIEEVIYLAADDAVVLNGLVGMAGFLPSLRTIEAGKNLALANKESLVVGGQILLPKAKKNNVLLLPVDSEHSAIYQCLMGNDKKDIKKIILTASGGPFRTYDEVAFKSVTIEDALAHPTYTMGAKITIDSSTLMNKALEIIEAHFLFDVPMDQIDVLVHKESIVHSMVEFFDGSVMAQLGMPDMRLPIQLALNHGLGQSNRLHQSYSLLELADTSLHFEKPNKIFRAIPLAYEVMEKGGVYPTVFNGANEMAVSLFLEGKIPYYKILHIIEKALEIFVDTFNPLQYEDIVYVDAWAREFVLTLV